MDARKNNIKGKREVRFPTPLISSIIPQMKRIDTVDLLFFIILVSWASDVDLGNITIMKIVGLAASVVWFILFLYKIFTKHGR
ncbi:MAG TPA: hypothetical protein VFF20_08340 [Pseudogracilibacillus sp.]|nr:hypothetical protein [Pseudogracilibacillus sp.]